MLCGRSLRLSSYLLLDALRKQRKKLQEPHDFESPVFWSKSRNWYLPLEMPINPGHRFIILSPSWPSGFFQSCLSHFCVSVTPRREKKSKEEKKRKYPAIISFPYKGEDVIKTQVVIVESGFSGCPGYGGRCCLCCLCCRRVELGWRETGRGKRGQQ